MVYPFAIIDNWPSDFESLLSEFFSSWDFVRWSSTCRRIRGRHIESQPYLCWSRLRVKHLTDIRGCMDWQEACWRSPIISPSSLRTIDVDSAGMGAGLVGTWCHYPIDIKIEYSSDDTLQIIRMSDGVRCSLELDSDEHTANFPDGTNVRLRQTSSVTLQLSYNRGAWQVLSLQTTEDCGAAAIAFFIALVNYHEAFPCLESVRFMSQRLIGHETRARINLGNRFVLPPNLVSGLLRKAPKLQVLRLWHIDLIRGQFQWNATDVSEFFAQLPKQHLALRDASWCFPRLELNDHLRDGEDISDELPEWMAKLLCRFPRLTRQVTISSTRALRKMIEAMEKEDATNIKRLIIDLHADDSLELGLCIACFLSKCPSIEYLDWSARCTDVKILSAFADCGSQFPTVEKCCFSQPFEVRCDRAIRARAIGRASRVFPCLKSLTIEEYQEPDYSWNESATIALCEEIHVNHTLQIFELYGTKVGETELEGQAIAQLLVERLPCLRACTISTTSIDFLKKLKRYLEEARSSGKTLPSGLTKIEISDWSRCSEKAQAIKGLAAELSASFFQSRLITT